MFETPDDPAASAQLVRDALEQSPSVGADADAFLEETGTQAFIVIRDDVVLYERYFGEFTRESIATSFSVAKSYLSALVGIAIDEGTSAAPTMRSPSTSPSSSSATSGSATSRSGTSST